MNVLLILADDMRADLLPFMPFVNGVLRREGTQFTNMRCNIPMCQPARAGLLTGQYARGAANGVYTNQGAGSMIPSPATHSLPVWLKAVGPTPEAPTTGMFGKYLTVAHPETPQPGWDTWCVVEPDTQEAYGYTVNDGTQSFQPTQHQLPYIASQVSSFITQPQPQPEDRWFCYYGPTNPHINVSEFTNNPLPGSVEKFGWLRWPFTLLGDADAALKPSWIEGRAQFTDAQLTVMGHAIRQQVREVYDLDAAIAELYNALVTAGRLEDTVIIFTSDSGVFYGEQRLGNVTTSAKNHPYDVVARVPCIVRGPGFPAGAVADTVTMSQDVTATITAIFDAIPSVPQDGVDLRSLITSPDPDRAVLYERKLDEFPDGNGVITKTRKVLFWTGQTDDDQYESYDLEQDADELTNLGEPADLAAVQVTLDELLGV